MTDAAAYTGGCYCGAVRYRIDGPLRDIVCCHCSQCRKTTGHFMPAATAWRDTFSLTEERGLKWYRASEIAGRGFCGECGCSLFWRSDEGETISVTAGTLDDSSDLKTIGHIFVSDKGGYYTLDSALPQYPQDDDGAFPMPE
ncbi:GFA family protein [Minwuia sp.]|uniref:GFA family protein n=1 Tax=Minwuia sp. TaxID=2493630 RepID=UPI003A92ADFA